MRRPFLSIISLCLFLAGCVDTTGLSAESSRVPRGSANAAIVVTEFADFQCPACKAAHPTIVLPLIEKYGSQIRYDFKHFPLRSLHRFALDAALAAECAADQGKFWEFVDYDYEHQEDMKKGIFSVWAEDLGLDTDLFDRCLASEIKRAAVLADYDEGVAAGVTGTPTFFVNGQRVESGLEELSTAIDAQLRGAMERL